MADIDKKNVQLDEKINKLTKRIRKDTEECEKLSASDNSSVDDASSDDNSYAETQMSFDEKKNPYAV